MKKIWMSAEEDRRDMRAHSKACRRNIVVSVLLLLACSRSPALGAQLKKVTIPFTAHTMSQLPFQLAERRGFFIDEGLTPEFVLMSTTTLALAIASQHVLYASATTS